MKFYIICFLFLFAYSAVAEDGEPSHLSLEECTEELNELNRTLSIEAEHIIASLKYLEENIVSSLKMPPSDRDLYAENNLLVLYLSHAYILALAYEFGGIKEHDKLLKNIDEKVGIFMEAIRQSALSYLKYADYLYLKLAGGNKKIIPILPILYRKALLLDKENKEARLKLAMWYIFAADEGTSNFRAFIEDAEEYIEYCNMSDKFNACLIYSIYYMKCYNTKKGTWYLNMANKIFPRHMYVAHLWQNYQMGKLGM